MTELKRLIVHLRGGRRVVFDERYDEWARWDIEPMGQLVVTRPDGTKRVFAAGRWVGIDSKLVS